MKKDSLKVLALNAFHGGSHKSFLSKWIELSTHDWQLLTLPGGKWKWRLRFAAVEFAAEVKKHYDAGIRWDVIFCTSMLNVAEFKGLTPYLSEVPLVVYFHENQITYPKSKNHKYDLGLSMVNINSSIAADQVWFNSAFHRDDFVSAARALLELNYVGEGDFLSEVLKKSRVQYQAVNDDFLSLRSVNIEEPVKLLWAARWEDDKNPGLLFLALKALKQHGLKFKVSIIGEELTRKPQCFTDGALEFADEIENFGFAESRDEYLRILRESDVFISTAEHEFFGVAAIEAVAAGCLPVVPEHQAYPEVLDCFAELFYQPRSCQSLVQKVIEAVQLTGLKPAEKITKYLWSSRSPELDASLNDVKFNI